MRIPTLLKCGAAAIAIAAALPAWAQTPSDPFTSWSRFDAERRLTGTISPDPDGPGPANPLKYRAVRNTYDGSGNLTRVERGTLETWQGEAVAPVAWIGFTPLETIETLYDGMDRKLRETVTAGGTVERLTQFSYDPMGRLECTAVRMNPATFGSLPTSACTPAAAHASFGPDRITRNRYDMAGRLERVETGVGTPDRRDLALYGYNANGRMTSLTEASGSRAEMRHDGHDRLVKWVFPSPTLPGRVNELDYEAYTWDPAGNRTSLRRRDGGDPAQARTIFFTYDNLDRLKTRDLPGTEPDVTYTYDLLGRMTGASQAGHALSFTYDALGRKKSETGPLGTVTSSYDAQGRRTRLTYPGGLFLDFDHLATGEMTRIRENGATSGVGVLATYGYDDLGRRTSLARGNGASAAFTYTGSNLASLAENPAGTTHDLTLTFAHNKAGQIVTLTRSNDLFAYAPAAGTLATPANRLNQLASVGGVTATHDPRGNMTADGTRTFAYDSENRLVSGSGGNTLAYDPMGRLFQHAVSGGATTRFLYDGDEMIGEYNGSNLLQRRFAHGPGVDEPLVWYEGTGTASRKWLHSDERGSIVALSDSTGAVTNINRYDEYGVPQGTVTGRFGYTGQAWLPELALWHYKARAYHPTLGRFMQTDPVGYDDQVNLYTYVGNDPLNLKDPLGLGKCGRLCWDADGDRASGPDVVAEKGVREFAIGQSKVVAVEDRWDAIQNNENISGVIETEEGYKIVPLSKEGARAEMKGDIGEAHGKAVPGLRMVMHGQAGSIAPGPLDDRTITEHQVANGIEHQGRFGILEFDNGKYRFTIEKGSLSSDHNTRKAESAAIQQMLNEFQRRRR